MPGHSKRRYERREERKQLVQMLREGTQLPVPLNDPALGPDFTCTRDGKRVCLKEGELDYACILVEDLSTPQLRRRALMLALRMALRNGDTAFVLTCVREARAESRLEKGDPADSGKTGRDAGRDIHLNFFARGENPPRPRDVPAEVNEIRDLPLPEEPKDDDGDRNRTGAEG